MPPKLINLGSSFASGPGITPMVDEDARRSKRNYAHLLCSRLGYDLTDVSVSGATLSTMLHTPQDTGKRTFEPQIQSVPTNADIILVLGGGNDIGYISRLFIDCFSSTWITDKLWKLVNSFQTMLPVQADQESTIRDNYGKLLDELHSRAPSAKILVVEYLTLIGPHTTTDHLPISKEKLKFYSDLAESLNRATVDAVQPRRDWCTLVPLAAQSRDHCVGSKEPWLNGFSWRTFITKRAGVLHPTQEGMEAAAKLIQQVLNDQGVGPTLSSHPDANGH